MIEKAAKLNIGEDLCNAFKTLSIDEFAIYSKTIQQRLMAIVEGENEDRSTNTPINLSFLNLARLKDILQPIVSSREQLVSLQKHRYCGSVYHLDCTLYNTTGYRIPDTSHLTKKVLREGLVLRLLLDHRDEPVGVCNSLFWKRDHFVSIFIDLNV